MDADIDVVGRVSKMVAPYLEANGIELIEMTYRREQGGMTLRLLVDTPEGVRISECEALNNHLSGLLDAEDLIGGRHVIEVSSPGLDRPIKSDRDFERALGRELEVTTFAPVDGRKTHEGVFIGMDRENIVIESAGVSTVIPRRSIALARLKIVIP
jgi:ribosome maturation factor RimP